MTQCECMVSHGIYTLDVVVFVVFSRGNRSGLPGLMDQMSGMQDRRSQILHIAELFEVWRHFNVSLEISILI